MRIKSSLKSLIGKIISGVVIAQYPKGNPSTRIYLTFSDGTAFEFWQDDEIISMASALNEGGVDQLVKMLERREGAKIHTFRAPHQDPDAIQQDMLT